MSRTVMWTQLRRLATVGLWLSVLGTACFAFLHWQEHRLVSSFVDSIDLAGNTDEEKALTLGKAVYERTNRTIAPADLAQYERWEAFSPFNVTAAVSLRHGIYVPEGHPKPGRCGTMSRVLLNSLWHSGVKARKLQIDTPGTTGHTLVEYSDGEKWKVVSAADRGFVWRNKDGEVATVEEIHADREVLAQVYALEDHEFPYNFKSPRRFFWHRLPNFVRTTAINLFGEEWYNNLAQPRLMDRPRLLGCYAFLSMCVACGLARWFTRKKEGTPSDPSDPAGVRSEIPS